MSVKKTLRILGVRGIPAKHGGFETFVQYFATYLVNRNWRVIVYCQEEPGQLTRFDTWEGVERVSIAAPSGAFGTIVFDFKSTIHASVEKDLCLTLGYNTAIFSLFLRLKSVKNVINMDGVEWRRSKWGKVAKLWFYLNEHLGCWLGNHLVADHPEIVNHLKRIVPEDKITMIPYGGYASLSINDAVLSKYNVQPGGYITLVARAEPENSILEIVTAFSSKPRDIKLLVLGKYDESNFYHSKVIESASRDVIFGGVEYDKDVLYSIRYNCLAYVHGHQVGGTNPSLVEALSAGNPIIAHNNLYNKWVAGDAGVYFNGVDDLKIIFDSVLNNREQLESMSKFAQKRVAEELNWPVVLQKYEELMARFLN